MEVSVDKRNCRPMAALSPLNTTARSDVRSRFKLVM